MRLGRNKKACSAAENPPTKGARAGFTWLKRLGMASFVFFLAKGLLWLLIPFAIVALRRVGLD